jgi:putative holliday junction resolvase
MGNWHALSGNLLTLGGEGGIRTHGPRERTSVFKTDAFDHSATSPKYTSQNCVLLRILTYRRGGFGSSTYGRKVNRLTFLPLSHLSFLFLAFSAMGGLIQYSRFVASGATLLNISLNNIGALPFCQPPLYLKRKTKLTRIQSCYNTVMRLLGIDYGTKHIGTSLSDEEGHYAFPHETLENTSEVVDVLQNICEKENVTTIILGESKNYAQKDNAIMKKVQEFKKKLEEKVKVSVILEPEYLTSQEAKRIYEQTEHKSRKASHETPDKVNSSAAALILQSYIDRKKENAN